MMASCNGQKKVSQENTRESSSLKAETPLTILIQDDYSGAETAETLVVRDAKTLKKFFAKVNRTRKPGLPVPEVDFSKNMVIIYCAGTQNEVRSLRLSIMEETDEKIVLEPMPHISNKGTDVGTVTSPFCVYSIPFTEKEIIVKSAK